MPTTGKTGFDASTFAKELGRVFGEYRQYNKRSAAVLLNHAADRLSGDLFNACAALRPSQQAKIAAVPQQTNYHVKRRLSKNVGTEATALATFKKGKRKGQFKSQSIVSQIRRAARGVKHVTVEQEIRLRQRFAALFQASGWLYRGAKGAANPRVMQPPCVVVKQLEGTRLHVRLENPRPNSQEFAESTGYLESAFNARIADMEKYIADHKEKTEQEWDKATPNFAGKDLQSEVERAMAA